jgi:hypothetical protein
MVIRSAPKRILDCIRTYLCDADKWFSYRLEQKKIIMHSWLFISCSEISQSPKRLLELAVYFLGSLSDLGFIEISISCAPKRETWRTIVNFRSNNIGGLVQGEITPRGDRSTRAPKRVTKYESPSLLLNVKLGWAWLRWGRSIIVNLLSCIVPSRVHLNGQPRTTIVCMLEDRACRFF